MDYTEFWLRTNSLIKALNKTQRGLALECGFTERRIETLSSNNRSPDVIEAVKIAKALNTTVEYLVTGEQESTEQFKANLKKELLKTLSLAFNVKPEDSILMAAENTPEYGK